MESCRYCRKTLKDCREADKKLITPLNYDNIDPARRYITWCLPRYDKAVKYVLGCYNKEANDIYVYKWNYLFHRKILDVYVIMPKCVWEGEFHHLIKGIKILVYENVYVLPLQDDYITILYQLASDDVSLPILP